MRMIRPFGAARRLVAVSAAVLTVGIGVVAGAPAAHASSCGWTGGWAPVTLENGWVSEQSAYDTGDPSYCLEADGMVYLSGSIAQTSGTNATFGYLPLAERPAHEIYLDVYTLNSTYGVLRIDPSGLMEAYFGSVTGYTSLAGVSFPSASFAQTGLMPLQNGWESAQSVYNTGDPAFSISNGIVHLSGSLYRPAGTPANFSPDWAAAILPSSDSPSDNCFGPDVYTFGGGIWPFTLSESTIYGASASYTSLAGISYPAPSMPWHSLALLNGTPSTFCNTPPSYFSTANVVYLTGYLTVPSGFNGEFAVLPAANRPTHTLYMIASNAGAGSTAADLYVTVRIDPDGAMWIFSPPNGAARLIELSGLSFHLGS
ncbi:MAG: hypothetical protein JWM19_6124 [Actinomycetia bacterium]|nr:hypothetical protein [Actinomycetes bacterium]